MQAVYKNYYCGLCFSLKKHYGTLSRFLVNYDVTLLAIALHCHQSSEIKRLVCFGQKRKKADLFGDDVWERLAAITILLAAEKMNDDIHDDGSFLAIAGKILFGKQIKKARKQNPQIYEIISEGYRRITVDEKNGEDVIVIGDRFADMMCELVKAVGRVDDNTLSYIRLVSRWLYYIDALDDYDKDIKKERFNPLILKDIDYKTYKNKHFHTIQHDLDSIFAGFQTVKGGLTGDSPESKLMLSVICDCIPMITCGILQAS